MALRFLMLALFLVSGTDARTLARGGGAASSHGSPFSPTPRITGAALEKRLGLSATTEQKMPTRQRTISNS